MHRTIEVLEDRRLLSSPYARFDNAKSVLRLFGTDGDDHVTIFSTNNAVFGDGNTAYQVTVSIGDVGSGQEVYSFNYRQGDLKVLRAYLGAGNDTVTISGDAPYAVRTVVSAGAGNDTIMTGSGADSIDAGMGADEIRAGLGNDTINAGAGNDRIHTGGGDDSVSAGTGNDRIYTADAGVNEIRGDAGDDTLFSGTGRDTFGGGQGRDVVDYSARVEPAFIDLSQQDAVGERNKGLFDDGRDDADGSDVTQYIVPSNDNFAGTGGREFDSLVEVEQAVGGRGGDVIIGNSRANVLSGGAGNDTIFAGGNADIVFGGKGDDYIFTTDTRYAGPGSPNIYDENSDFIDGGSGHDFARVDGWDLADPPESVETIETLPYRPLE